jgi:hypothetical protein
MLDRILDTVYRHLYLVWGTVVVGTVCLLTGALFSAIIGYTFGLGCVIMFERLFS